MIYLSASLLLQSSKFFKFFKMGLFLKPLTEFVTILLLLYVFGFLATRHGMLASKQRIEPTPPCTGRCNFNNSNTRNSLQISLIIITNSSKHSIWHTCLVNVSWIKSKLLSMTYMQLPCIFFYLILICCQFSSQKVHCASIY